MFSYSSNSKSVDKCSKTAMIAKSVAKWVIYNQLLQSEKVLEHDMILSQPISLRENFQLSPQRGENEGIATPSTG